MKRLTLFLLLLMSTSVGQESNGTRSWSASIDAGAWLIFWDQFSNNKAQFGSSAIDVDYTISAAVAPTVEGHLQLGSFSFKANYQKTTQEAKTLQKLAAALNYAHILNNMDLFISVQRTQFQGALDATAQTAYGSGTFETDLILSDAVLFVTPYVGVGVRSFYYEVPQDYYLVNGSTLIKSGLADLGYRALYYQLMIDNARTKEQNGWRYSAQAGAGTMRATGTFLAQTDANLVSYNNGVSAIEPAFSWFTQANVAYEHTSRHGFGALRWDLGYAIAYQTVAFKQEAAYSLITSFSTLLHGPFAHVGWRY